MPVAYQFANATNTIPLSQLDANFASPITLGNTSIQLGNSVSTLGNLTLGNVTITSGNIAFAIPATSGGTGLVSPGSTGNVLTSNGTAWISTGVAPGSGVTALSFGSTGLTPSTSVGGNVTVAGTLLAGSGGTGLSSPGANGNVLTSTGSAWVSSAPAGGGSAMTLISTFTASGQSSFAWTGLSTYKSYILIVNSLVAASSSARILCRVGYGSTPTYLTSGYNFAQFRLTISGGTMISEGISNGSSLISDSSIGYIEGPISGFLFFSGMDSASNFYSQGSIDAFSGGTSVFNVYGGNPSNTQIVTAINLFPDGSTWSSGSASLYGISS